MELKNVKYSLFALLVLIAIATFQSGCKGRQQPTSETLSSPVTLTDRDQDLIKGYTKWVHAGGTYAAYNGYLTDTALSKLRSEKRYTKKRIEKEIGDLIKALKKLPDDQEGTYYRSIRFMKDSLLTDVYIESKEITENRFQSMTDIKTGAGAHSYSTHLFVIRTNEAKRIEGFSDRPEEKESLMLPGQRFLVTKIHGTWQDDKTWNSPDEYERPDGETKRKLIRERKELIKMKAELWGDLSAGEINRFTRKGKLPIVEIHLQHMPYASKEEWEKNSGTKLRNILESISVDF